MRGRGTLLIGGGLLVAAVSVVGALGLGGGGGTGAGGAAAQSRSSRLVSVDKGTLTRQAELDGQLGHGPQVPFPVKAGGTVTWLPRPGAVVRRGAAVLRADDRPVTLLYGSLPMYRELAVRRSGETSTPLRGMDVKQFETNLAALGYAGFTVDESYTRLTADAVKRWQEDLGLPRTGRVGAGDVVYAPGAVRIAGTSVLVGGSAAGTPVSYTSTARMVTVNAPAGQTSWAEVGARVTVDLPDGRSVGGEVASVGGDATAPGASGDGGDGGGDTGGAGAADKAATVAVVVTFDEQGAPGRLQSGPVTVRHVEQRRTGVLSVPVAALVALAEGGYGLEVPGGGDGDGRFVPVRTGLFADGRVEVSGPGVREGLKVRIPQ
ncbi:peptidoglycan-binding domain-containing protein [Streptomyces sp. NPDC050095]|uniref:peptidoglycan-binding domain-containing protein n=1 Tax=unclassified Streptomyces TaxID=2593676 RepID=UPI0034284422